MSAPYTWITTLEGMDWQALSHLYRIAPLGEKSAADLQLAFSNSRYACFVYDGERLIGAGRGLADGVDCAYLCDVAVHPNHQGEGLGKAIVLRLVAMATGHRKIILYAAAGKEGFYHKLGFRRMKTAMAIFHDQDQAVERGVIEAD